MKLILAIILLSAVYTIQKYLYRKYWNKGLLTEVRFSRDYIECGESAELIEVVSNDKTLPLPVFHMKFSVDKSLIFEDRANSQITDLYHKNELFSILGHQKITRKLEFTGSARGVVSINNASVLVKDFFMTEVYACKMNHSDVIYIFPKKIKQSPRFSLAQNRLCIKIFLRDSLPDVRLKTLYPFSYPMSPDESIRNIVFSSFKW